jgi:hypothetical protein
MEENTKGKKREINRQRMEATEEENGWRKRKNEKGVRVKWTAVQYVISSFVKAWKFECLQIQGGAYRNISYSMHCTTAWIRSVLCSCDILSRMAVSVYLCNRHYQTFLLISVFSSKNASVNICRLMNHSAHWRLRFRRRTYDTALDVSLNR